MKAKDGKLYAEVTLRDVVENYDVSDSPILAEVKRLYAENDELRELMRYARNELKKAEDELGRDLMNSATVLLGVRMRKLGIEVGE